MAFFRRILLVIMTIVILLLPANISFSDVKDTENNEISEIDTKESSEDEGKTTRSGVNARANYKINLPAPVNMPKVNESWTQDDWSGGPGQDIWSDSDKFNYSSDLNISSVDGHIELAEGSTIQAWKDYRDAPMSRARHRMVWNPQKQVFYVFGGERGNNQYSDQLHEYNPTTNTWRQINPSGSTPSSRCSPLMVYDTTHDYLWIYGGRRGWDTRLNDVWYYDPTANSWTEKSPGPGGRCDHTGAFNPNSDEIIVWGGYTGDFEDISEQVFTYNTSTNTWTTKKNYTERYYLDSIWCPRTNSMLAYGGASKYDGGWTFVNELNEYFPNTDTWTNRTPIGSRVRHILSWDALNDKMILYGGENPNNLNTLQYYDVDLDSWETRLASTITRETPDGDWDDKHDQFVVYGGRSGNGWRQEDTFGYLPNVIGFEEEGGLRSSVYNPGYRMNMKTLSFNLTQPVPPQLGEEPVEIQIAGSDVSPATTNNFIGFTGYSESYFTEADGQTIPKKLDGSKYLAYTINVSTEYQLYTPELNWVKIDYYIYPDDHTYESPVLPADEDLNFPLRFVNWTSSEPADTGIDIYFRQASAADIATKTWEKVTRGQKEFGYKSGEKFQYKAVLKTDEPGYAPTLQTLFFVFNQKPTKPTLESPVNDTWIGDSKPNLVWKFNDPDTTDYQTALEVNIAQDNYFSFLKYTTNILENLSNSITVGDSLEDGIYYWRVRLRDNYESWGPWSEYFILKIDTEKPTTPTIDCKSHKLDNVWYKNNRIRLDWNTPYDVSGIAGFSFTLDPSPDAVPSDSIDMTFEDFERKHNAPDFTELVTYDKIPDGIWYFHLKASDTLGTWSEVVSQKIRIDTKAPVLSDKSPLTVTSGASVTFKFIMNDTLSGIDLATITWKYETEADFRYEELALNGTDEYSHSQKLEMTEDEYIEYQTEVSDLSEPPNKVIYPTSGYKRIYIVDDEPPVITDVDFNKVQNRFKDLAITVKATDNIGVTEAKVYFNDESTGRIMTKNPDGSFSITIDRVEVADLEGYQGENKIGFKVGVWDTSGNNVTSPTSGNYEISLEEIETPPDKPETQEKEDEGVSSGFYLNLAIMIIIVIIVAIVLFLFIRKQSEKMGEDRHKLRMAIADVTEAAAAGTGEQPSAQMPAAPEALGLPGTYDAAAPYGAESQPQTIDITPTVTPQIAPGPPGQDAPVGYLPEATGATTEPPIGDQDSQAYQQAGLMTGPDEAVTDQTVTETQVDSEVEVDQGVYVSLPEDSGSSAASTEQPLSWTPPPTPQPSTQVPEVTPPPQVQQQVAPTPTPTQAPAAPVKKKIIKKRPLKKKL
jgi:N-acetylneuraminic acid mutarotase